jgi:hypothetical protein
MKKPIAKTKGSSPPTCSEKYVQFVQQSRKVLGSPEKSAPTERLNPSLHGLMQEAFSLNAKAPRKRTN